jgi:hypothetical protein
MTDREIKRLVELQGKCSYNDANKQEFRRLGTKLARAIRKELGMTHANAEVHFNAGGIAVSGDVTLRVTDGRIGGFYLTFNADGFSSGLGIMYRHCSPDNLYGASTSTPNHWYVWSLLVDEGLANLVHVLQWFMGYKCIANNMHCTGHVAYSE